VDEDKETAGQDIEVLEAQSAEERLEYFRTLFDRCTLCSSKPLSRQK
jgi:hypothetical protein